MLKGVLKKIFNLGHLSGDKISQMGYKAILRAAFLTAAFLMLPGAAMTSHAAVTWEEDGGKFRCYDREGEPISGSWVKDGGGYYYIDEDGLMAADRLIEDGGDTYYVGSDGAMVKKQWVHITDMEYMNEWFYFGSSGKAYKDGKKKIGDQTYLFDGEGCMLSGWQRLGEDGELYYLGTEDEGFIHSGWQLLEPWEEMDGDYEREEWFYFQKAGGKAYRDGRKQINGSYYYFDENGVALDQWISASPSSAVGTPGSALPSSGAAWADEVTKATEKGWVYTYAPGDEGGDEYWYYLDSFGVPFNAQAKDIFQTDHPSYNTAIDGSEWMYGVAAKVIDGKTYLFDENGKMMTGFYYLSSVKRAGSSPLGHVLQEDGDFNGGYYYFNEKEGPTEGQMMTGKQKIEVDGDDYHYYFKKNGVAYVGIIVDGALFSLDGSRIFSEYGEAYSIVPIGSKIKIKELGNDRIHVNCKFIVNSKGRLVKNGTVEIDGVKYTVKNYEIKE